MAKKQNEQNQAPENAENQAAAVSKLANSTDSDSRDNTVQEESKDSEQGQDNQTSQNEAENQENSPEPGEQNPAPENAENKNTAQEQKQNQTFQKKNNKQSAQNQPAKENEESPKKDLIAFRDLAEKYRLPTWQSAAILKLLDKEDDAYLSEQEFLQAVEKLFNRKMGA